MIIGITGGTGCGKTTLLDVIREQGGTVLDCDAIYHRLLREDPKLLKAIADRFPGTVENGELQRKKLGAIAFSDPQALEDLNAITHSAVKLEVIRLLESKPQLAAIDAIGLFEGELAPLCDLTVAVTAPEEARIQALLRRFRHHQLYFKIIIFIFHCGKRMLLAHMDPPLSLYKIRIRTRIPQSLQRLRRLAALRFDLLVHRPAIVPRSVLARGRGYLVPDVLVQLLPTGRLHGPPQNGLRQYVWQ